jgi:hypothetical protein
MQLRKPAIWIATASPFALYALFAVLGSDSTGLQRCRYETSPTAWMVDALGWFTPVLPMIFGIVLADRLVRHRKLGVAELLDSTPTNPGARLVGKYLGVCAAKRMCPAGASPARSDCSRQGLRPRPQGLARPPQALPGRASVGSRPGQVVARR